MDTFAGPENDEHVISFEALENLIKQEPRLSLKIDRLRDFFEIRYLYRYRKMVFRTAKGIRLDGGLLAKFESALSSIVGGASRITVGPCEIVREGESVHLRKEDECCKLDLCQCKKLLRLIKKG